MRPITKALRPKFTLTKLQQAVQNAGGGAIYDPSSLWGAGDHLPRRNLLTYTEDFSNAIWTKFRGPTLTGGQLDPLGGSTATKIIPTSAATSPGVYQGSTAVAAGTTVRISFYAKAAEFSWVMIGSPAATGGVWFNVSTGTIGTITGGFGFTAAIEPAANGFFRCTLIGSAIATTFSQISVCDGNGSTAVTNSGTNGVIIWGAQLSLASTLDKSYQKITDWTTEQYAWAAAKNVPWLRRNLLTYSEDFSNAAWSKGGYTVTTNTTLLETTATTHALYVATSAVTPGVQFTLKARIRGISRTEGKLTVGTAAFADSFSATFNLGTVSVVAAATGTGTVTSATIVADGLFFIITLIGYGKTTAATHYVELDGMVGGSMSYVGDVTKGFELSYLQLSVGTCDYQPIGASWDAQFATNAAAAGVALTLYQDSAGTTAVSGPDQPIGKQNDLSGGGYHAVQSGATGLKPVLRLSPNGGWYLQRDLSDDNLVVTFPNLGSNCVSYVNDGATVTETTGVTLNGATNLNTPAADYGRVYLASPSSKSASIIKWLKAKAGIA